MFGSIRLGVYSAILLGLTASSGLADSICLRESIAPDFELEGTLTYKSIGGVKEFEIQIPREQLNWEIRYVELLYGVTESFDRFPGAQEYESFTADLRVLIDVQFAGDDVLGGFVARGLPKRFALGIAMSGPDLGAALPDCGNVYVANFDVTDLTEKEGEIDF